MWLLHHFCNAPLGCLTGFLYLKICEYCKFSLTLKTLILFHRIGTPKQLEIITASVQMQFNMKVCLLNLLVLIKFGPTFLLLTCRMKDQLILF